MTTRLGSLRSLFFVAMLVMANLIAAVSCSSGAGTTASTQTQERILLGLVGALTGPNSDLGNLVRNGAEVAADEINSSGGLLGKRVEFVALDTGGDPAKAVSGFQRAISQEKVVALIGPTLSSEALAVKQVVNDAKIVQMIANAANIETLVNAPWSFNVTAMDDTGTQAILQYAEDARTVKPAVIHDTSGFGQGGMSRLEQFVPNYKTISFSAKIPFQPNANDLTPQVLQARQSGADSVIVWATGGDAALVAQNMKQIGWSVPLYSTGSMMQPSARRLGDAAIEGAVVRTIIDSENPALKSFFDKYERKTGTRPILDNIPVQGYVAVKLYAMAVQKAGSVESGAVKKALESLEWKDSPLGPANSVIKFGPEDHRTIEPDFYTAYRFEKGNWVRIAAK